MRILENRVERREIVVKRELKFWIIGIILSFIALHYIGEFTMSNSSMKWGLATILGLSMTLFWLLRIWRLIYFMTDVGKRVKKWDNKFANSIRKDHEKLTQNQRMIKPKEGIQTDETNKI